MKDKIPVRWVPYVAARLIVQMYGIRHRDHYMKWHDSVKPIGLPKKPNRVYDEWIGWNDFLGNDNVFSINKRGDYLPYWEAVRWVHRQGYRSAEQYYKAYEDGEILESIPKHPHHHYRDMWVSWPAWLGKDLGERIVSEQKNIAILAIIHVEPSPGNVIHIMTFKDGITQMKEWLGDNSGAVVKKTYIWEDEFADRVKSVIGMYCSEQGNNEYVVGNINSLYFELDNLLMWYKEG